MGRTTIQETVREKVDERGRKNEGEQQEYSQVCGWWVLLAPDDTTKENGRKYCSEVSNKERERNTGERFKCFSIRGDFIKAEIPASREGCGGRRDVPESGGLVPRRPRCESSKSSMEKEIEKEDTGGEKEENG